MEDFRHIVEVCELLDLGFRGPKYTWANDKEGMTFIKERLDCGLANQGWCDLFPEVIIQVEVAVAFDHSPLTLSLGGNQIGKNKRRFFHYEAS